MSIGSIIGGVAGAIAGFFIGGPMGAVYGASLGFGVGAMIDPMTPDMPSLGTPAPEQSDVMISEIGTPIADLCGSTKITGHLLWYGNEKSVAITQEQSGGGKGGEPETQTVITGYKYYMTWAVGICEGPIDALLAIYRNDQDLLYEGPLSIPTSGGKETIVIDDFGSIEFYFGTSDQVASSVAAGVIDSTLNSPLRGMCWAVMNNCYVGEYNRCPTLQFIVSKFPSYSWSAHNTIQEYDCNPMHAIYYILNSGGQLPASWLNEDSFVDAAMTLFEESRGISIKLFEEETIISYIESINSHIDNIIRYDTDSTFHIKLIRDDYTVGSLPVIDEDDLDDDPSIIRPSWLETANEIKIQYSQIFNVERPKTIEGYLFYSGGGHVWGLSTVYVFTTTGEPDTYVSINSGNNSIYALDKYNKLYSVGTNNWGQLGLGDNTDRTSFTKVTDLYTFTQISADSQGSVVGVLRADGTVWGSGYNFTGLLANNTTGGSSNSLVQAGYWDYDPITPSFQNGVTATEIAMSNMHALIVRPDGTIWAAGNRANGALGDGITSSSYVPYYKKVEIWGGSDWIQMTGTKVWCGRHVSFVLKDGTIWACGSNHEGVLGLPLLQNYSRFTDTGKAFVDISTDGYMSIAIAPDGTLWGTGNNDYGQLGRGYISTFENNWGQIGTDNDWKFVCAGWGSAIAIKNDYSVYAWGYNQGKLGLGDLTQRLVPTLVPDVKFSHVGSGNSFMVGLKL